MKKTSTLLRIISLTLTLCFTLSLMCACVKDETKAPITPPEEKNGVDLNGFNIIYAYGTESEVKTQIDALKSKIASKLGVNMTTKLDLDTPETEKEILVGDTDRAISEEALSKLTAKTSKDAYIIEITDTKIVINATTDKALARALKVFTYEYLDRSSEAGILNVDFGATYASTYEGDRILTLENGVEIETVVAPTTLFEAVGMTKTFGFLMDASSSHYPSIIELQHQKNPEDNGKLIAHFCLRDSLASTDACFMESTNGGKTWKLLSRPEEQSEGKSSLLRPGQMAHIYELPEDMGNYPAGTIVYASGSINYSIRSEIWVWYSTDCGKTWTQKAEIAEGGGADLAVPGWHEQSGVWEPFLWYDNGYLYCFYSDDSDKNHDQKLVYRRTKDGVNWESIVDVCTFDDPKARPGMFIMTKMGNGEYFMVYEYVADKSFNYKGAPIYYKTTKDISDWGDPADPGTLLATASGTYPSSAPSCIWVPTGGDCGTLIVSATSTSTHLYISFDYGKTWSTFTNPLPYTSKDVDSSSGKPGYSAGFWLGADQRTVYYINTTNIGTTGRCRIQFTSFKVY